jgi:ribosome assembly protein 1
MLYPDLREDTVEPKNKLERDLWSCDTSEEACVVAYVSKMFAVPVKELPQNKRKQVTAEELRDRGRSARAMQDAGAAGEGATSTPAVPPPIAAEDEGLIQEDETLIGFARLYSGTLHLNTHIYCILPKYTTSLPPTHPRNTPHILSIKITALYVMMGRELVPVESVKAGSVFAVGGLEGRVWRNATLCGPGAKGLGSLTLDGAERDMGAIVNLAGVNRQVSLFFWFF